MIKTLSIPQDLQDFLNDNPDLSPSKMLQSKIIEIRDNRRLIFAQTNKLRKQVEFYQKQLWEANEKIILLEKKHGKKTN